MGAAGYQPFIDTIGKNLGHGVFFRAETGR